MEENTNGLLACNLSTSLFIKGEGLVGVECSNDRWGRETSHCRTIKAPEHSFSVKRSVFRAVQKRYLSVKVTDHGQRVHRGYPRKGLLQLCLTGSCFHSSLSQGHTDVPHPGWPGPQGLHPLHELLVHMGSDARHIRG